MLSPFLALSALACPVAAAPASPIAHDVIALLDEEFDKRFEAADKDPKKLWDLVVWCESTERDKELRKVLRKLIRVEPDHREARGKLGHVYYDGQWFTTEKKLAAYKKKQAAQKAKELGLVEYKGEWVHPGDVEKLEAGLIKNDEGRWVSREELEKVAAGWVKQDLTWVAPDEMAKMDEGLWKCGEEWLSLADANAWHSRIGRWWSIPSDNVILHTTCDRGVAFKILEQLDRGYRDLARIYGGPAPEPVQVLVLRTNEQMLRVGEGDPDSGQPATDGRGMANSNRAYFAESWFGEGNVWTGMGVSFWDDEAENGAKFAVHDVRLALGLSFADALDPSPKAIAKASKKGPGSRFVDDFLAEKRVPTWYRWGSAGYVSRWYEDNVLRGGDPYWTRKWSAQNISAQGGLHSFSTLFDFPISGQNTESARLVNEAGLLIAFTLDGKCLPVTEAHAALKQAIKNGEETDEQFARLQKELESHESELKAFAGL